MALGRVSATLTLAGSIPAWSPHARTPYLCSDLWKGMPVAAASHV